MARRSPKSSGNAGQTPATMRCLCATMRRASRLLTRRYEETLRPTGVTVSQFELMQTLEFIGEADQGRLATLLETDQTTMSRGLKVLVGCGWVSAAGSVADGRVRVFSLSDRGRRVMAGAAVAWGRAQRQMDEDLGGAMAGIFPVLDGVMVAARGR